MQAFSTSLHRLEATEPPSRFATRSRSLDKPKADADSDHPCCDWRSAGFREGAPTARIAAAEKTRPIGACRRRRWWTSVRRCRRAVEASGSRPGGAAGGQPSVHQSGSLPRSRTPLATTRHSGRGSRLPGPAAGRLCRLGRCCGKSESFRLSSISLIPAASRINTFAGHGRLDLGALPLNLGAT
jgi:hypothetical protein